MHSRATPSSPEGDDGRLGRTRRERLKELLLSSEDGVPLDALEKMLEATRSTIINDLEHLRLSFRHQSATLLMVPPSCTTTATKSTSPATTWTTNWARSV